MSELALFDDDNDALFDEDFADEALVACRVCGCTERDACETPNGACFWLEPDLCSACARSA